MSKDLWRTAFGDDGESGYPGCLRNSGYDREGYEKTRDYIKNLVEKVKAGHHIPKGDIPALCNIIHELCMEIDDDRVEDSMEEILDIVEELLDKDIKCFRGDYAFLSNYYECDVKYDGILYKCSEAAFQAQKCIDTEDRKKFAGLTGSEAKKLGKKIKLRDDWNSVKYGEMRKIVKTKFDQNPDLAEKLLATGNAKLEEGNSWGDTTWGVDDKTGYGSNELGVILMDTRDELKEE